MPIAVALTASKTRKAHGLRLHSVLISSLPFLMRFSVVLFLGLAGRLQKRSNKIARLAQGTKHSKFLKKAQAFVIDDLSSCDI